MHLKAKALPEAQASFPGLGQQLANVPA
jgi:hypothetical protein